jgi:hypothetical protein
MKPAVLLFAAALLSGCATGHLYPVDGPLAAQRPAPIYRIGMDYGDRITAKLGKGESCEGSWLVIVPEDPTSRDMAAEWDLVYGKGYFLANVQGKAGIAHATLTCPKATDAPKEKPMTVNAEFDSKKGVAKDSNGNVFKLTF